MDFDTRKLQTRQPTMHKFREGLPKRVQLADWTLFRSETESFFSRSSGQEMKNSASLGVTTLVFILTGLVGPIIRWMTWPPSAHENKTSTILSSFVDDLVFLLWPTQPLAAIEVNTGPIVAGLVAAGTNMALFAIIGMLAGLLFTGRVGLLTLYIMVVLLASLFSLWGAGFSLAYINFTALAVGLLIYASPFALTDWYLTKYGQRA